MRKVLLVGVTLAVALTLGVAVVAAQGPRGGDFWMGGRGGYSSSALDAVAEALGLETDALLDELQAGKTVAEVAEAQGVALDDVVAALLAGYTADLDAAVEEGTITREVADARLTLRRAEIESWLAEPIPARVAGMVGLMAGRGYTGLALDTVAEALGLETDALLDELQAGKTVAEIAEAQGVALADVIDAVIAAAEEKLAAAVEAGTLTQAQADAQLALLGANLDVQLTTSLPLAGRPFDDRPFDDRPFDDRPFDGRGRGGMGMRGHGFMGGMPGDSTGE